MKKILSLLIVCLILTNCAVDPYTGEKKTSNTAKGALIGAAGGALVGGATKGKDGALKGALIGGATGGLVGGYMDMQAKALRQELQGTGVQVSFEENKINLIMPGNITFNTGSHEIKSSFYSVLNSIIKVIAKYNNTRIEIIGYTDNTGSATTNNALSLKRAQSVGNYFVTHKIKENRLLIDGAGSSNPIAANSTASGREQNRRVEIKLIETK